MLRNTRSVFLTTAMMAALASGIILRAQEKETPPRAEESSRRLAQVVQNAARTHKALCNQFLIAAIKEYLKSGQTFSSDGKSKNVYADIELDDLETDQQVDYITTHWTKLELHQAVKLASKGKFVVAGLKGQPGFPGHVAVVMPGGSDPTTKWPVVAGGGVDAARSIAGKSMTEVWRHAVLHPKLQVEFFTPRSTTSTVTADSKSELVDQSKAKSTPKGMKDDDATKKTANDPPKDAAPKKTSLAGTTWANPSGYKWTFVDESNVKVTHPNGFENSGDYTLSGNEIVICDHDIGKDQGTLSDDKITITKTQYALSDGGFSDLRDTKGDPFYTFKKTK